MEIKATLKKPFTEDERINFIIENNHRLGYEIKDTDEELQAWGYTEEEIEEHQKQAKIQQINSKISELNAMVVPEMLQGNEVNIQVYREVIQGLKDTRDNL